MWESIAETEKALEGAGYLPGPRVAAVVYLALQLKKPLLIEGPAGVGKTELAKAVARASGRRLIRLQCYEGLDETRALYEWNYQMQLLRLQASGTAEWRAVKGELYGEEFLLARPLLQALTAADPVMLLIDELDKSDEEFESFLLEALSDFQVSIPELGTLQARQRPPVFITSNSLRDFGDALRRRCLYLYLEYPDFQRELAIVRRRLPVMPEEAAEQAVSFVQAVRRQELKKPPSIAETLDWVEALSLLGSSPGLQELRQALPALCKYRPDQQKVEERLAQLWPAREAD